MDSLDALSEATFLPQEELQDVIELLREKRQIILEGPPGSGKTYIADLLARHFSGNPLTGAHDERVEVVQFHQSYAYEDFVQGIRPRITSGGTLEYRLEDGIFKRLCERARSNPDQDYVLVVDEINRGNLSRIFGELLLLLEYRERSVALPYSEDGDRFSIPKNLYLIGTMNTTDRSLAQIDYALRRRFYFYRLMPTDGGQAPVLSRWLAKNVSAAQRSEVLSIFLALNDQLSQELGEHFQVGHSYFMQPDIGTPAGRDRVWRRAIKPLLEEYFYNRRDRDGLLDGFRFDRLSGEAQVEPELADELD